MVTSTMKDVNTHILNKSKNKHGMSQGLDIKIS